MAIKTKFLYVDNNWKMVKNACRITVNKDHTDNEPSDKFKLDILISEHSPVRLLKVGWIWDGILSWVATHWSRHKWECFISTQRTDRTGVDRNDLPQGELVKFQGDANEQNLIDSWRKRLCFEASKETRVQAEDLKIELDKVDKYSAYVLVPNCIYRCGCPEFNECGFFKKFKEKYPDIDMTDIRERYKAYNEYFINRKKA